MGIYHHGMKGGSRRRVSLASILLTLVLTAAAWRSGRAEDYAEVFLPPHGLAFHSCAGLAAFQLYGLKQGLGKPGVAARTLGNNDFPAAERIMWQNVSSSRHLWNQFGFGVTAGGTMGLSVTIVTVPYWLLIGLAALPALWQVWQTAVKRFAAARNARPIAETATLPTSDPSDFPSLGYAASDRTAMPFRQRALGIASLLVATLGGLASYSYTRALANRLHEVNENLAAVPVRVAELTAVQKRYDAEYPAALARMRAMLAERAARLPYPPLGDAQISSILNAVPSQIGRPLDSAIAASLRRDLQQPNQTLIDSRLPLRATQDVYDDRPPIQLLRFDLYDERFRVQMIRAVSKEDDELVVWRYDLAGRCQPISPPPTTAEMDANLRSRYTVSYWPQPQHTAELQHDRRVVLVGISAVAVYGLLSLYLLIVSIRTLLGWRRWFTHHGIYCCLGFGLVAAGFCIRYGLANASASDSTSLGIVIAMILIGIYPALLLVILLACRKRAAG